MTNRAEEEIWVFGDLRNERFFGWCLNVLAKARELAKPVSGKVVMVLVSLSSDAEPKNASTIQAFIPVAEAEKMCIAHGADKVYIFNIAGVSTPRVDIYGRILADAVLKRNPMLVLFAITDFGRELASHAAILSNAGLIADCLDFRFENGAVVASSPSWGGEIMAEITFTDRHKTGFATVQPHILTMMGVFSSMSSRVLIRPR